MKHLRASLVAAFVASMALSACERPATTGPDTVVAKVGDEVISAFELDRAMARLGPMNAAEAAQARGKVLGALVDQHLVSSAARNARFDRVPEVALAMQQAQRQVLVEAYMERLFKDIPKSSNEEIRDYYNRHSELFAQRKVFRVQELELQPAPARVAGVEAQLKKSRSLSEFIDWLGAQGIDVKSGVAVRPAEKIPAPMLAQLLKMKDGQVIMVPTGGDRFSVLQLQGSQAQPVSLDEAKDAIDHLVQFEKRTTLLDTGIRKLRSSAKVEYASGFEPAPDAANPATQPGKP